MKLAWLLLSRSLLAILAFILLYVLLALLLSALPTKGKSFAGERNKRIYLHSNGVHLDIILPADMITATLRQQLQQGPDTKFFGIGWGDKGFYLDTPTWAELSPVVAIKAMFLPSPTAMHVTSHRSPSEQWSYVDITQEQLDTLNAYISAYFSVDTAGKIQEIPDAGYTSRDHFYEAEGNYSCFMTCNTWVNVAMKQAGIKTAVWTPMDSGVLRHLKK